MIKAIENRADWFTTDMYQLDPWDKDNAKAEADKYRKYGYTHVLYLLAVCCIVLLATVPFNLIVLGYIPTEDYKSGLIFTCGVAMGGFHGVVSIICKFKDKLERGY